MEGAIEYRIESLRPSPLNIRTGMDLDALEGLAASIRTHGILEPLVIREAALAGAGWEVIAGCRRLEAAKMAGLTKVPVVIRRHLSDRDALEIILIENCQREDLNPIDRAKAYQRVKEEYSLSNRELSARIGTPEGTISEYLRLLQLPEEAQVEVALGAITRVAGLCLARVADQPEVMEDLRQQAKNDTNNSVILSRTKAYTGTRNREFSTDSVQRALDDLQLAVEQAREKEWQPVCRNALKTCDDITLIREIAGYIRVQAGIPPRSNRSHVPARWKEAHALSVEGLTPKAIAEKLSVTPEGVRYMLKRMEAAQ